MEKKWEELQEKLQEEANRTKIDVPDTLKPENIETLLNEQTSHKKEKQSGKKAEHKWRWKAAYTYVAAACLCLIIGGIAGGRYLIHRVTDMADTGTLKDGSTYSKTFDAEAPDAKVATAKDYNEIYEYLQKEQESQQNNATMYATEESADMATGAKSSAATSEASTSSAAGYSDTNVRQAGVGEGDIIKTDGSYIYSVKDGQTIQVIDIQSKDMSLATTIDMSKEGSISEIYLKDKKLYVFYTEDLTSENQDYYKTNTCIKTFDMSDIQNPKEIAKVSQSGNFYTMRVVGDYMYLFSEYAIYDYSCKAENTEQYIPCIQGETMDADRIYMPVIPSGSSYTIITSVKMNQPDQIYDSKALLSSAGMCYVSTESIYMCDQVYGDSADYNRTTIRKLNYQDGKLSAVGQTKIWGVLNDSFSIDEYDGYLRVVTTISPQVNYFHGINPIRSLKDFITGSDEQTDTSSSGTTESTTVDSATSDEAETETVDADEQKDTNALYILDADLKQVEKLEGLAKDEQVYSARFLGDVAYFVTYKQVDPLFSADLSDPKNPKILGELKIPGFSEYLHPYSENLLLGIGMDTDEDGMTTNGVKLSMFDITNPSGVSELNKQILKNVYGSDVFYNYKSVLIDAEKNLIGFSAYGDEQHYYVYSYDDNSGFTCLLDKKIGTNWYGDPRGIYVDNRLYILEGYAIESYDLTTFDKIDDIVL